VELVLGQHHQLAQTMAVLAEALVMIAPQGQAQAHLVKEMLADKVEMFGKAAVAAVLGLVVVIQLVVTEALGLTEIHMLAVAVRVVILGKATDHLVVVAQAVVAQVAIELVLHPKFQEATVLLTLVVVVVEAVETLVVQVAQVL
jgi:hypothetical protein